MESVDTIRRELLHEKVRLCPERAYLVTEYYKKHADPREPVVVQRARALHYILARKTVEIYPGESIVGNAGTSRKSCILQPELGSAWLSQEIPWIDRRRTNPFPLSARDKAKLLTQVIPYWLRRSMPSRMFPSARRMAGYVADQLNPTYYLINEAGGIGHFLPDYEKMLRIGTSGYRDELAGGRGDLHKAALIVCDALEKWADRFAIEAERLARETGDLARREELEEVARICRKVPREPAGTFHEALQSLWFTHLGVMLESLNSAVSFGRIDQYLHPYYQADIEAGAISRDRALELLLQFSAKTTEHVFLLSQRISEYHGGYLVVQAAIVGGMDGAGNDATNDLTYLMLDCMERHRMRDPNYQARVHAGSPPEYLERCLEVARQGYGVPALFNDDAIVPALVAHGYPVEVARDYGIVGCVEPSIPGRSFLSTDAGLFNLPICLELALNSGYRWKGRRRVGAATPDARGFENIDDVIESFRVQLNYVVDRMIGDFHMVEKGNMDHAPTPLSSMLVEGCINSGCDLTEGGATYNSSGIQGVGVADVADSLAALDAVVFKSKRLSIEGVLEALKADFRDAGEIRALLLKAPKFGNDIAGVDAYADLVVHIFHDSLARHRSLRGGDYVPGFYSVTCHVAFGSLTGALPSGRGGGEPFGSGVGPACGADRRGPTALLNSVSCLDTSLMPNGNALNLRFDPVAIDGEKGIETLSSLTRGFFENGGMELQFNVLDPEMLEDARANPGKYPELVVRVAGYCAYFDDLPNSSKEEIIRRTRLEVG